MAKNKKPIVEHMRDFFNIFLEFGKVQPTIRAVVYWAIVVVGSLAHDFHRPPESYFSNKKNIFNVVFVKSALAWTLGFLAPFVALSSSLKSKGNVSVVLRNVSRLVVAVLLWFVITGVFDYILDLTGFCEGSELFSTKNSCQADGLPWRGFDISGHSFLLTYCSLMLSEEIQALCCWNDKQLKKAERVRWKQLFRFAQAVVINVLYVCCCLLLLLWEVMLFFTTIYFHTVETKIIGIIVALSSWALTYKFWYETDGLCSPGLPTKY